MKAVVFLDRDGTIIVKEHYPREAEKVAFLPNAVEGLKLMREKGYRLYVVSNQSGVGRGIIKDQEFNAVHQRFCEILKEAGIEIEGFGYCFHTPADRCGCRKPQTGLVPRSLEGQPIAFDRSVMVGDSDCDIELGKMLGVKSYRVPEYDLLAVAQAIPALA